MTPTVTATPLSRTVHAFDIRLQVRRAPSKPALDSHQYEAVESEVFRGHVAQRFFSDRGKFWTTAKTREAVKWSLAWAIGAATAVVGLSITFFTKVRFSPLLP